MMLALGMALEGSLEFLWAAHLLSTLMMTGLIWFIQRVHYPLFCQLPPEVFPHVELFHARRISWIVIPCMLVELGTGIFFLMHEASIYSLVGVILIAIIWLSTFFLQVPCHQKLADTYDVAVCRRLVSTNWIRTIAWSARSILLLTFPLSELPS